MMPKGVEHGIVAPSAEAPVPVRIPMMPKGVEHNESAISRTVRSRCVRIPMMPKGVEHVARLMSFLSMRVSENSDDAERR